jgi:hypothetical protein
MPPVPAGQSPQTPSGIIAKLLQLTRPAKARAVLSGHTVTVATPTGIRAQTSLPPGLDEATTVPEIEPELTIKYDTVVARECEHGHNEQIKTHEDYNPTPIIKDDQTVTDFPVGHDQVVTVPAVQHELVEHSTTTDPEFEQGLVRHDTNPITDESHFSPTLQLDRDKAIDVLEIANKLSEYNTNAVQETEHNLKDYKNLTSNLNEYNKPLVGRKDAETQPESTPYIFPKLARVLLTSLPSTTVYI